MTEAEIWSNRIAHKTIRNLLLIDKKEWLAIYNCLDGWNWDNRLGDPPEGWELLPDWADKKILCFATCENDRKIKDKHKIISPILKYIESAVGLKAIFRDNSIRVLGETEQDFEDWWNLRSLYSKPGDQL